MVGQFGDSPVGNRQRAMERHASAGRLVIHRRINSICAGDRSGTRRSRMRSDCATTTFPGALCDGLNDSLANERRGVFAASIQYVGEIQVFQDGLRCPDSADSTSPTRERTSDCLSRGARASGRRASGRARSYTSASAATTVASRRSTRSPG